MPGLVKIGKTSRDSVHLRLNELYSTGVPVPFECAFAGRIADESKVEKAFHMAFGPYRVNPKREFFSIEPEQTIALLELMVIEDVTPQLQCEADSIDVESKAASKKLKSRRPVQNFVEMGLPIGAELDFGSDGVTCLVVSGRKVEFEGEEYSLTALTQKLLGTDRPLQPSPYWSYEGKGLNQIYDETYGHV
ncbi:MAG TPA: GIY-YIG nuclease family protein [Halothiobacillaceae bacterium]|nr:GIY-YIG nuclease family protein [Halothiobacillaceae bacterium]